MTAKNTRVLFLGARGSVPVGGSQFARYGGDTSCVLVQIGGENILLDAGSGLMRATSLLEAEANRISILLTHPHIDHMIGLPCFPLLYDKSKSFTIMTEPRQGLCAAEQISAFMCPPLWPVCPKEFLANVWFEDITEDMFKIGDVVIEVMQSNHPGGCSLYRLSHGSHSIAYCTDFEHDGEYSKWLADFAANASLLVYDGYFSDAEYDTKRGWGHSTWEEGVRIARRCGAKRLVITHHHPQRTDTQLHQAEQAMQKEYPSCLFAQSGMEIIL